MAKRKIDLSVNSGGIFLEINKEAPAIESLSLDYNNLKTVFDWQFSCNSIL